MKFIAFIGSVATMLWIPFTLGCSATRAATPDTPAQGIVQEDPKLVLARATLQCREQALAHERESLEAERQSLALTRQSLQKIEALLTHNAELLLRLQQAEQRLASRISSNAETHEPSPRSQANDLDSTLPDAKTRGQVELSALRTVQGMIDSGRLKVLIRNGHGVLIPPRRLDDTDPYSSPNLHP